MRRHTVTDMALGLVFIGLGILVLTMGIIAYSEPYRCDGLPCNVYEVFQSRSPLVSVGFSLLFLGIGGRMIWNVWRRQN